MMKPSEFQTTIENQFDYICKVAMDDERKDYFKSSTFMQQKWYSNMFTEHTGSPMMRKQGRKCAKHL